MRRFFRGRRRLLAGIALAILVVAAGLAAAVAGGLLLHDTATPASLRDALRRFREDDPHPGPRDGVYLYSTRGSESIDALGGAHHAYPATTTVTAIQVTCGTRLRWEALQGRSTSWTLCATPRGLELRSSEEVHRFFGQTDRTDYACTGAILRPARSRAFVCRSGSGTETGTVGALGSHVRTVGIVTGGDRGTETVDWWLAPHGSTPLRIRLISRTSRHELIVGRVHYREDADLRLVSTTPRR